MGRKPLKRSTRCSPHSFTTCHASRDSDRGLVASGTKRLCGGSHPSWGTGRCKYWIPVKHESVAVSLQCLSKAIQPIRGKPGKRARLSMRHERGASPLLIRPSVACASSSSRRRKNSMVNCITQIYGSGLFDSLFIQPSRSPIAAAVGPGDDLQEVAVRIFEIETATIVVILSRPVGFVRGRSNKQASARGSDRRYHRTLICSRERRNAVA